MACAARAVPVICKRCALTALGMREWRTHRAQVISHHDSMATVIHPGEPCGACMATGHRRCCSIPITAAAAQVDRGHAETRDWSGGEVWQSCAVAAVPLDCQRRSPIARLWPECNVWEMAELDDVGRRCACISQQAPGTVLNITWRTVRFQAAGQCCVAVQHIQGCHPESKPEYSELFHTIGPDAPTLQARFQNAARFQGGVVQQSSVKM